MFYGFAVCKNSFAGRCCFWFDVVPKRRGIEAERAGNIRTCFGGQSAAGLEGKRTNGANISEETSGAWWADL